MQYHAGTKFQSYSIITNFEKKGIIRNQSRIMRILKRNQIAIFLQISFELSS